MAKINATKEFRKNGDKAIKGYYVQLSKVETENAGFKEGDEVIREYQKNKIIITKKEN